MEGSHTDHAGGPRSKGGERGMLQIFPLSCAAPCCSRGHCAEAEVQHGTVHRHSSTSGTGMIHKIVYRRTTQLSRYETGARQAKKAFRLFKTEAHLTNTNCIQVVHRHCPSPCRTNSPRPDHQTSPQLRFQLQGVLTTQTWAPSVPSHTYSGGKHILAGRIPPPAIVHSAEAYRTATIGMSLS